MPCYFTKATIAFAFVAPRLKELDALAEPVSRIISREIPEPRAHGLTKGKLVAYPCICP